MPVAYNKQMYPANGKHAQVAEKIYQTLMSNRKLGHIDKLHAAHIIKTNSFRIFRKKYIHWSITLDEHPIQAQILYMPRYIHTCKQKPNPYGDQSLYTDHFILRQNS